VLVATCSTLIMPPQSHFRGSAWTSSRGGHSKRRVVLDFQFQNISLLSKMA